MVDLLAAMPVKEKDQNGSVLEREREGHLRQLCIIHTTLEDLERPYTLRTRTRWTDRRLLGESKRGREEDIT